MEIDYNEWFYHDLTSPTGLRIKKARFTSTGSQVTRVGDVAGCVQGDGYGKLMLFGEQLYSHRVIWEMYNGKIPDGFQVDHKDGDKANLCVSNLRLASPRENACNKKRPTNNTSGIVGVRLIERTIKGKTYSYWRAFWNDGVNRQQLHEDFPIHRLGNDVALGMAMERRRLAIIALEVYSERHGNE